MGFDTRRVSFHQNKFYVILDDTIGFIWFSEESCSIAASLVDRIGYLVPNDRREIVES